MNTAFWESDEPESTDEFWANDADEESDQQPQSGSEVAAAPTAEEPEAAVEPLPAPEVLDELRKRESALVSLKECLAS